MTFKPKNMITTKLKKSIKKFNLLKKNLIIHYLNNKNLFRLNNQRFNNFYYHQIAILNLKKKFLKKNYI